MGLEYSGCTNSYLGVGVLSAGAPGWKWTTWIGMDYLEGIGVLGWERSTFDGSKRQSRRTEGNHG